MRASKLIGFLLIIFVAIYILGPHPEDPILNKSLPKIADNLDLDSLVHAMEQSVKTKPNNEAKIIWHDSSKKRTEYAIVYLHGFSASQMEGDPIHKNIAQLFQCNLYLARLSQHGIDTTEEMMQLTADNYWESAKTAYAIGKKLGKKVILMSTSTGGTLSLQLAADFPEIAGQILYSPNIAINNPVAFMLDNPWGLQIGRIVQKGKYMNIPYKNETYPKYWNSHYRIESVVALQNLLEATMTEKTFKKVNQPTLVLYYYKDKHHQDQVVKVSAIKKMFDAIATSPDSKSLIAVPNTGNHVLASPILSKDISTVEKLTAEFISKKIIKK